MDRLADKSSDLRKWTLTRRQIEQIRWQINWLAQIDQIRWHIDGFESLGSAGEWFDKLNDLRKWTKSGDKSIDVRAWGAGEWFDKWKDLRKWSKSGDKSKDLRAWGVPGSDLRARLLTRSRIGAKLDRLVEKLNDFAQMD